MAMACNVFRNQVLVFHCFCINSLKKVFKISKKDMESSWKVLEFLVRKKVRTPEWVKRAQAWSSTLPCKVIKSKIYQLFRESVFRWFNSKNNTNLLPSFKECLFGLSENSPNNSCRTAKLNYTLLFMRFYIYSCQLHNKVLTCTLSDFAKQIEIKYQLEKFFFNSLSRNRVQRKSFLQLAIWASWS